MVITMSAPDITDRERQAVLAVLATDVLSIGPVVERFEAAVANASGARHAVACSSGTSGLHLALAALGVKRGSLVLTTPFSFIASANAILYRDAIPVFVDVDPVTGNIDADQVGRALADLEAGGPAAAGWLPPALRKRKRFPVSGVLSVDVFGQPADADALQALTRRYGIPLIEDACEAFGARYRERPAGSLGDAAVFGFYPNKQITTGEGGAVVTDDPHTAALCRSMRNQGRDVFDSWLGHTRLGYNYRLPEMAAALGVVQVERLPELLQKRDQVAQWYNRALAGVEGVETPRLSATTTRISWFVYVIRVDAAYDRDEVVRRLAARGVPSRLYFPPIHLQPFYRQRFGYGPGMYPVTEELGARSLALPFSGKLGQEQVVRVVDTLQEVLPLCLTTFAQRA
jgi:perosamine synthetase